MLNHANISGMIFWIRSPNQCLVLLTFLRDFAVLGKGQKSELDRDPELKRTSQSPFGTHPVQPIGFAQGLSRLNKMILTTFRPSKRTTFFAMSQCPTVPNEFDAWCGVIPGRQLCFT
jgi:hypothetical protein